MQEHRIEVKTAGNQWEARCPCHDDRRASLSIGRGDDGRALLHCHAGCSTEQVVAALGLTMADLMPSDNSNHRAAGRPEPITIQPQGLHLTDTGLAERFAKQHGANVRYLYPWLQWLAWDGKRWNPDCTGIVEQFAKATARSILHEAADEPDGDRCKELTSFALRAESAVRRSAMLRLAQSEPGIPILPDELDRNWWLLNLPNGTLELCDGTLRKHRREDRITKLSPVEYHADAECPTWLQFLADIFRGNVALVNFVQRLLGYCLSGDTSEQILPIFWGTGANGKSTLIGTMLNMLGEDYAIKAANDFLLAKRTEHPTERADLHGKRLVACVETGEGRRLDETLVKDLTGNDKIRARRMRECNGSP